MSCVVPGCKSARYKGARLFFIPKSKRFAWFSTFLNCDVQKLLQRKDPKICARHFKDEHITLTGLHRNAFPVFELNNTLEVRIKRENLNEFVAVRPAASKIPPTTHNKFKIIPICEQNISNESSCDAVKIALNKASTFMKSHSSKAGETHTRKNIKIQQISKPSTEHCVANTELKNIHVPELVFLHKSESADSDKSAKLSTLESTKQTDQTLDDCPIPELIYFSKSNPEDSHSNESSHDSIDVSQIPDPVIQVSKSESIEAHNLKMEDCSNSDIINNKTSDKTKENDPESECHNAIEVAEDFSTETVIQDELSTEVTEDFSTETVIQAEPMVDLGSVVANEDVDPVPQPEEKSDNPAARESRDTSNFCIIDMEEDEFTDIKNTIISRQEITTSELISLLKIKRDHRIHALKQKIVNIKSDLTKTLAYAKHLFKVNGELRKEIARSRGDSAPPPSGSIKKLSPLAQTFIQLQFKNGQHPRGRRFTPEEIELGRTFSKLGTQTFRFMREHFCLPSRPTTKQGSTTMPALVQCSRTNQPVLSDSETAVHVQTDPDMAKSRKQAVKNKREDSKEDMNLLEHFQASAKRSKLTVDQSCGIFPLKNGVSYELK